MQKHLRIPHEKICSAPSVTDVMRYQSKKASGINYGFYNSSKLLTTYFKIKKKLETSVVSSLFSNIFYQVNFAEEHK